VGCIGGEVAFPLQHLVELVDHRVMGFSHSVNFWDAA
jgi:hypothetical protein